MCKLPETKIWKSKCPYTKHLCCHEKSFMWRQTDKCVLVIDLRKTAEVFTVLETTEDVAVKAKLVRTCLSIRTFISGSGFQLPNIKISESM